MSDWSSDVCSSDLWHDLPVGRISIVGKGVVIDALPYNDEAGRYDHATLSLFEAEAFAFDIQGETSLSFPDNLEITTFDFAVSAPGRITGTLGILARKSVVYGKRVSVRLDPG